jgi:hypothetical protein
MLKLGKIITPCMRTPSAKESTTLRAGRKLLSEKKK